MYLQIERSPVLATPDSLEIRSAGTPISSLDSHRPPRPQPHKMLSRSEERDLADRWQHHGDISARDQLILAFMPLVEAAARRYAHTSGQSVEDLTQAGAIGLMRAVDRFDYSKARLSTFARFWVKAEITKHLKAAPTVKRAATTSLNVPVTEDQSEMQDLIVADPADQDDVLIEAGDIGHLRDRLDDVMDVTLDDRERVIFEARCLSDDPPILDDLAKQFGVSRERIRQIQGRALVKVEEAAKQPPKIGKRRRLRSHMAEFYACTTPRHHHLEGWLDATRKRFPEATMQDRLTAHREAEKLREAVQ